MYIGVQRHILRELDLIVVHTLQKNMFIDTAETQQSNVLASMASNWDSSFYYLTTEFAHLQYLSAYVRRGLWGQGSQCLATTRLVLAVFKAIVLLEGEPSAQADLLCVSFYRSLCFAPFVLLATQSLSQPKKNRGELMA